MDAIYTYRHYGEDSRPRLTFPKRTGRRTTYAQWLAYQYALHHDDELPAAALTTEPPPPPAPAFVNHGRWLWLCPGCLTAVQVCDDNTVDGADLVCCPACFGQGFVQPEFPDARAEIEAELLRQPGYRLNAPFRNWEPGWSLELLQERTATANAKIAAGEKFIRSASIGVPRTWAVGEVLTAANMNTYVREIQKDLIGTNGAVELLHGMRPGTFTTAEVNALSGIVDGVMLYNSTTQRHEYFVGGNRRGFAGVHESGLFAAGAVVTVTHDLGFAPTSFQLLYERVGAAAQHGHDNGDQVFVGDGALPPGWAVFDVTATSYKVAMVASSVPTAWVIDDGTDDLWRINALSPASTAGTFGNQGELAIGTTWRYLAELSGDLYTTLNNNLWKIDPDDPDSITGGYGDLGNLPWSGNTEVRGMAGYDGDLWILDRLRQLWRIDVSDPGNRSGGYGDQGTLPAGAFVGLARLDNAWWTINTTGTDSLFKIDPDNLGSTSGGYGDQGEIVSGLSTPRGISAFDRDLYSTYPAGKQLWKINPADPGQDSEGYGNQGRFPTGFGQPYGLALVAGDPILTAQITAATGDLAGYQAEITVDNDAAAGGWGARMLAFA